MVVNFEIWKDDNLIKRGKDLLSSPSWDIELMEAPTMDLTLPIEYLEYLDGRESFGVSECWDVCVSYGLNFCYCGSIYCVMLTSLPFLKSDFIEILDSSYLKRIKFSFERLNESFFLAFSIFSLSFDNILQLNEIKLAF